MTYIIKRVELENFLSHRRTVLDLSEGSTALVGENGAGKTSILEAINFALTLRGWRGRLADLIRAGSSSARVRLILEDINDRDPVVEVSASITARGRRGSATSSVTLKEGQKLVTATAKDYPAEIARVLGISAAVNYGDFLDTAIIVRQGGLIELSSIISQSGKRLKELLENAIGIPHLRVAQESIKGHTVQASVRGMPILAVEIGPRRRDTIIKSLDSAKDEKKRLLDGLRELRGRETKLSAELSSVEDELRKAEQESKEICDRAASYEVIESNYRELQEQLRKLMEGLKRARSKEQELQAQLSRAKERATLAALKDSLLKVDDLTSRALKLRAEVDRLSEVERSWIQFSSLEQAHKEYERLRDQLARIVEEERALSGQAGSLEARKKSYDELIGRARGLADELAKALGLPTGASLEDVLRLSDERLKSLREQAESMEKAIEDERAQVERLSAQAENLREILGVLTSAKDSTSCPVCGSRLTAEKAKELKERYAGELKEVEEEFHRLRDKLTADEEILRRSRELLDRAGRAIAQLREILSNITELSKGLEALDDVMKRLSSLSKEREEVERRVKELEDLNSRYLAAQQRLKDLGVGVEQVPALIKELERKKEELKELEDTVQQLTSEVLRATKAKDLAEARRAVQEAQSEAARVGLLEEQLRDAQSSVKEIEEEVKQVEGRVKDLEKELADLKEAKNRCAKLQDRLAEIGKRRDELSRELASVKASLEKMNEELSDIDARVQELSKALDKLDAGLGALTAFDRLGRALYRRALIDLENAMNEAFQQFGLDYSSIEVRESEDSFEFAILDRQGNERQFSSLSGGEQVVVSLAYIIALNRVLQSKIGFLLLDEPTDMLDEERRRHLMEILGHLAEEGLVRQLLIITHHSDLVDYMDRTCHVSKGPQGASQILCEED